MIVIDSNNVLIQEGMRVKFKDYYGYRFSQCIETEGTIKKINRYGQVFIDVSPMQVTTYVNNFSHYSKVYTFHTDSDKYGRKVMGGNRGEWGDKTAYCEAILNTTETAAA
jgi:hypothetical protein